MPDLLDRLQADPAAVEILDDILAHNGPGVKSTNGVYCIARWYDFAARVNGSPDRLRDPDGMAMLRALMGTEYRETLFDFRRQVIALLRWLDDVLGLEQTIPPRLRNARRENGKG